MNAVHHGERLTMCCGCWEKDGAPKIDNEKVRAALPLIDRVYEFNAVGGCLHVELDDNNLEDDFFETDTLRHAAHAEPHEPGEREAEDACYAALKAMTHAERVSALGLHDGCWQPSTPLTLRRDEANEI